MPHEPDPDALPPFAAEWMQQWRSAGVALAEQRADELRAMTDEQALAASEALLEIGASLPLSPERWTTSGLVIQQALLHGRKPLP